MSADSPTYNCSYTVFPSEIADAAGAWCMVSNGHRRMDVCCSQLGNGTVGLWRSCDPWCDINSEATMDEFRNCLSTGPNSTNGTLSMGCKGLNEGEESRESSANSPVYSGTKASTTVSVVLCAVLAFSLLHG